MFDSPVPPGSGWPGDPATAGPRWPTTPAQVRVVAERAKSVEELDAEVTVCRACPRLVEWREEVAVVKRQVVRRPAVLGAAGTGLGGGAAAAC